MEVSETEAVPVKSVSLPETGPGVGSALLCDSIDPITLVAELVLVGALCGMVSTGLLSKEVAPPTGELVPENTGLPSEEALTTKDDPVSEEMIGVSALLVMVGETIELSVVLLVIEDKVKDSMLDEDSALDMKEDVPPLLKLDCISEGVVVELVLKYPAKLEEEIGKLVNPVAVRVSDLVVVCELEAISLEVAGPELLA